MKPPSVKIQACLDQLEACLDQLEVIRNCAAKLALVYNCGGFTAYPKD